MKRTLLLLLIGCLATLPRAYPSGQYSSDSLHLQQLYKLALGNIQKTDRLQHVQRLYTEAKRCKHMEHEANAMFLFASYYYATNVDSLYYWSRLAIPMFRAQKRYDELFRLKAWLIYSMTREKKNKEALDGVNELKALAKELNYPDGEDMANQALANYYLENELESEGVTLYEEILAGMEKRDAPLTKRINIIKQLMNKSPFPEQQIKYLDRLRGYIEMCENKGIKKFDDETPVCYLRFMMHRNYAQTYIFLKKLDLALSHLQKAKELIKEYNIQGSKPALLDIYISYYNATREYDKTVNMCDTILTYFDHEKMDTYYLTYLRAKADALFKGERYEESALFYSKYAEMKDSLSSFTYYTELANMKTQHNVDKLELRNKQMEMQNLKDRHRMLFLFIGVIILIFISLSLGCLAFMIHRFGRQLKIAKEKAEEADKLKSAFLANMNHEIRTPLNAIVGFSQVLIEEEDKEKREEFAQIIYHNNELLQRLISDVLDISKIESNMITFTYALTDLPQLMKEIYNTISLRVPEGVELIMETAPAIELLTDRNRLTQILTNLLTNATKHTEKGYICFGYKVFDTEISFYVKDSGQGIPADKLETVFSRFVQLSDYTKGVGLGLAICKGFVTKLGGRIELTSEVGVGSTFTVILPRK